MAKFENPRKKFNWGIQLVPFPINSFMFQKVSLPDLQIEAVAHGDTNHDVYTAGRVSYGKIKADKLLPSDEGDSTIWAWAATCQSGALGGGSVPSIYKRTITISEFAEDGSTILNQWVATGVWPSSINGQELDRMSSDNSIESIEFSCDLVTKSLI